MNSYDIYKLVEAMCNGDDNAYHTLLEADQSVLPILIELFSAEKVGMNRARIVEVIRQHRSTSTIPFLFLALNDPYPEVWRVALDGLVAIGGSRSKVALVDFRSAIAPNDDRRDWIDEAIEQIRL